MTVKINGRRGFDERFAMRTENVFFAKTRDADFFGIRVNKIFFTDILSAYFTFGILLFRTFFADVKILVPDLDFILRI